MQNVIIAGKSGTGKSRSIKDLDPESTVIINCDTKPFPFREEFKMVVTTTDFGKIREAVVKAHSNPKIKRVIIDTINTAMLDKEMFDKRSGFSKWSELAENVYDLMRLPLVRPDFIVYYFAHTDDVENNKETYERVKSNGRKLEKIVLESLCTIVLYSRLEATMGNREYYFQTNSLGFDTSKSPEGMFPDRVPNDLNLVDKTIREYYGIGDKV